MERPDVEDFKRLCADQSSPWGMADSDVLDLCNYILELEGVAKATLSALKMIRNNWSGHSEACAFAIDFIKSCDCDWPKIAKQCDNAIAKAESMSPKLIPA